MTNEQFLKSCKTCTPDQLRQMLAKGADANARDNDGFTALMLAALNTEPKVSQMLLEAGANIGAKHRYGFTALDLAVLNPNPGVAGLLKLAARNDPSMTAALMIRPSFKEMEALLPSVISVDNKYGLKVKKYHTPPFNPEDDIPF